MYQNVKPLLFCTCCPELLHFKLSRVYLYLFCHLYFHLYLHLSLQLSISISTSVSISVSVCNIHTHIPRAFEMSFILWITAQNEVKRQCGVTLCCLLLALWHAQRSTHKHTHTPTHNRVGKAGMRASFDLQCPHNELRTIQKVGCFYTDLLLCSCPGLDPWSPVCSVDAREIDVIC